MELQINTLDNAIENGSVYIDYPLSKTKLSERLGCSRRYIIKLATIAFIVSDYKEECPKKDNGGRDTTKPLTPYQTWVISRVRNLMTFYCNQEQVKSVIRNNKALFAKDRYEAFMGLINNVKAEVAA